MKTLAVISVLAAMAMAAGCGGEGERGDVCHEQGDCAGDLVCVSQVLACTGDECWGSCERECVQGTDCDPGEACRWVNHVRICRGEDYENPRD